MFPVPILLFEIRFIAQNSVPAQFCEMLFFNSRDRIAVFKGDLSVAVVTLTRYFQTLSIREKHNTGGLLIDRECAGFIAGDHGATAQAFHRGEFANDHIAFGHTPGGKR